MKMARHPLYIFSHSFISLLTFIPIGIASDTITSNQSITDGQTLVSIGQRFELGFFSPGNTKKRYLGIWYKSAPNAPVWVANRETPITDSDGLFTLTGNGTLVLYHQTTRVIWSSNESRVAVNPVVKLLDTGNLVVTDSENYTWQSFDFPTDTRLRGMIMGHNPNTGRDAYLRSWKSTEDPSLGDFTYRIQNHGLPQMVILKGGITKTYRSGPWNGIRFSGFPILHDSPKLVFHDNLAYMYSPFNDLVIGKVTLNELGFLQFYRLDEKSGQWSLMLSSPSGYCDNYGYCGANGICSTYNSQICECLNGFIPKSQQQWQQLDWSSGCVRRIPVGCLGEEGFLKVEGVKLPDILEYWLDERMSLKECEIECLKNCSCVAYTNSNISGRGSGCLMWFGDLIDVIEFTPADSKQNIYVRLAASEIASISGSNKRKRVMVILVVSIISGVVVILGMVLWSYILKKRTKKKGEDWELPLFNFAMISSATDNFSKVNLLGVGGFGPVYKGNLPTGQKIAVKRLSKDSGQGLEEFKNEIFSIAKLQHRNLVRLVGCCIEREERMLIYEYMPNKSLDCFIFGGNENKGQNGEDTLSWKKRFEIIMGIARGLLYLHQDSRLRIIHRDLKTSNILLDSQMNPKISDFGLARILGGDQMNATTKRVVGTHGYMSPEYIVDGNFSVKSDVFSFGVVLLEIVSGRKNRGFSHPNHHHNLLGHAWLLWNEDKALELLDTTLEDSYIESQVLRCVHVGLLCVQKHQEDRPTMSVVVSMLDNMGATMPQSKQPGHFIERSPTYSNGIATSVEFHTENNMTITVMEPR